MCDEADKCCQVDKGKLSLLPKASPHYLMLVCEIRPGQRKMVRVLVSEHRGYIFIQTHQPVYSPTQSARAAGGLRDPGRDGHGFGGEGGGVGLSCSAHGNQTSHKS